MKKAIVTGIRGQDGAYLSKLLIEEGYKVIGADRRSGDSTYWRLRELGILDEIELVDMDLLDRLNVFRVINEIQPDEIYNLAAQSFVGASFNQPIITTEINANSVLFLLETIRTVNPRIKFYQASTSEMFGKVQEIPQTEKTPFYPRSPYAVAKLFAHWAVVNYRESYNLFAASGILFNHESPLRGEQFVTRKITLGLARIKSGKQDKLLLGNLEAKRDWGHAKEYVRGMWSMLQNDIPDTFVLATGVTHSVKEFVDAAAAAIDMDIVLGRRWY